MTIDTQRLTVAEIQAGFADGSLTSEALTAACLAAAKTFNPRYNAIIYFNESALEDARAIDARRAAGEQLGPLAGIPIVVKDTMDMVGFPTTAGWHLLSAKAGGTDLFPERDCPAVARVKAAGCIIIGKTNVPILSASGTHADNSWAGPTLNAAVPGFVPGGSTAGSATSVVGGFAILGLAEETGGSIQNPAAAQALVGLKPTFGLVPNVGVVPLGGSTLDVVGPVARTVEETALLLTVLAGPSAEDPKTEAGRGHVPAAGYAASLSRDALKGARLGLYGSGWRKDTGGWRSAPMQNEVATHYASAIREITALGSTCIDDPFVGSGFADLAETLGGLDDYDMRGMESIVQDLAAWLKRLGPSAAVHDYQSFARLVASEDPFAESGILTYLNGLPEFHLNRNTPDAAPNLDIFRQKRADYQRIFHAVLDAHNLDALVFPQMLDPLPRAGENRAIRESTVSEINIAGLPVLTVPAGYLASGAPFNLAFVGRLWSEEQLLNLAYAYEQATRHRTVPQLVA